MLLRYEIEKLLKTSGAADVGFCRVPDGPEGLPYAVSFAVALSDAVVDEIGDRPTQTYYHHYRTVNAFIDRMLLQTGLLLQKYGFRYIPVAASQSIRSGGDRDHTGRYSHKKAAVLAGLGTVGKSALFLHRALGPRVRLGTLFTDCPLGEAHAAAACVCGSCTLCADACPSGAIKGAAWRPGLERGELLDAEACNSHMRAHFMQIGRGAVCGICMRVCPAGRPGGRSDGNG